MPFRVSFDLLNKLPHDLACFRGVMVTVMPRNYYTIVFFSHFYNVLCQKSGKGTVKITKITDIKVFTFVAEHFYSMPKTFKVNCNEFNCRKQLIIRKFQLTAHFIKPNDQVNPNGQMIIGRRIFV